MKSKPVAYLLWLCLGVLGIHRFYCKKWFSGALYFCTGGLLIIGWLMDIVKISRMVDEANGIVRENSGGVSNTDDQPRKSATGGIMKGIWRVGGNIIKKQREEDAANQRFACKYCSHTARAPFSGPCHRSPHGNHETYRAG